MYARDCGYTTAFTTVNNGIVARFTLLFFFFFKYSHIRDTISRFVEYRYENYSLFLYDHLWINFIFNAYMEFLYES